MAAAALALSGCLKQTAVIPHFTDRERAEDVRVIDARPASDKDDHFLSLLVWSCDYSIRRIGDNRTVPSRMKLLQRDLSDRLGAHAHGQTVTVTRYVAYLNQRQENRKDLGNYGPVGSLFKAAGSSCTKEKTSGGWYSPEEISTPNSPIVVEIEASMDGQTHAVRAVYSTSTELYGAFGEPAEAEALFAAMRKATDALAEQLLED
jgi:hypothetical protein